MKSKILIFIIFISFSACKETNNSNKEVKAASSNIFEPVLISSLEYNLHPYNGTPIFTYNHSPNYYFNIIAISKNKNIKDEWGFDELTYNDNLIEETKNYVLSNINEYNLVLFLVDNNLQKQDKLYSPTENFSYKIYTKDSKKWILKKEGEYKEDIFIYLDSEFREEAKEVLGL